MPPQYWSESVLTDTSIINKTPSLILQHRSPFELLSDKSPNYSALRIFGCLCYASNVPSLRNKFLPLASQCVFLGYLTIYEGYKLLDLTSHKSFISGDVISYYVNNPVNGLKNSLSQYKVLVSLNVQHTIPYLLKGKEVIWWCC